MLVYVIAKPRQKATPQNIATRGGWRRVAGRSACIRYRHVAVSVAFWPNQLKRTRFFPTD
jgi:hypothetical protein